MKLVIENDVAVKKAFGLMLLGIIDGVKNGNVDIEALAWEFLIPAGEYYLDHHNVKGEIYDAFMLAMELDSVYRCFPQYFDNSLEEVRHLTLQGLKKLESYEGDRWYPYKD